VILFFTSTFVAVLLPADARASSDQQPTALCEVAQLADLGTKLLSATNHITRLELQLDVCGAEQQALEQAAAVLQEQQATAWGQLLQEMGQLHADKHLSDTAM
jgi:hypothetical protein